MNIFHRNLLLFSTLTAAALAQQPQALLFTPKGAEQTRSGSGGTVLAELGDRSVAVVVPSAMAGYSAEKFAPALAFQTLAGDEDGDGDVYTPDLMGATDALLVLPYRWDETARQARPRNDAIDVLDVYFSPKVDLGTFVAGSPSLRKGDCGRIVRTAAGNGQVSHFIRAEQLIRALGMVDQNNNRLDPDDIDLDAIAVTSQLHILVSFEDDHIVNLRRNGAVVTMNLPDGAVACIPPAAWVPNALGEVDSVAANGGFIAITEPRADALVANAGIADAAGNCVNQIVDVDGLAVDGNGGTFQVSWGTATFTLPHLLMSAETLTGAGVISTIANGSIAVVNGRPMGAACGGTTTGIQTGLAPGATVGSLDGLETLDKEPRVFVLGSPTPTGLGGAIQVHVGTNLAVPGVFVGFGLGNLPVSPSIPAAAFLPGNQCFPELYPAIVGGPLPLVPVAPVGGGYSFGALTFAATPVIPPGVVFQAVTVTANGAAHLSSPITVH